MARTARTGRTTRSSSNDRLRAPMPAGHEPPFLVLPPTPEEAAEGIGALLVTPYPHDRPLSAEQVQTVEAVRANVVLPVTQMLWVSEAGTTTPARLERDQLRLRLVNCWAFGVMPE